MKEYVIDAKNMDEKSLNRTIKEQAPRHDKLIINYPESKHNICAGSLQVFNKGIANNRCCTPLLHKTIQCRKTINFQNIIRFDACFVKDLITAPTSIILFCHRNIGNIGKGF